MTVHPSRHQQYLLVALFLLLLWPVAGLIAGWQWALLLPVWLVALWLSWRCARRAPVRACLGWPVATVARSSLSARQEKPHSARCAQAGALSRSAREWSCVATATVALLRCPSPRTLPPAGASHPLSAVSALTPAFRDDHALIYRDKLLPCGWRHSFCG